MSLYKEQIEKGMYSKSGWRKWMKRQMNKFMRRKPIEEDDKGHKSNRKHTHGWEF